MKASSPVADAGRVKLGAGVGGAMNLPPRVKD